MGLRRRPQRVMADHVLIARHGTRLELCLAEIGRLRDELRTSSRVNTPSDGVAAVELDNLLTVAEMMARAALVRTESRGSHYREDFPDRDDVAWNQVLVIRQRTGRMELTRDSLPVIQSCQEWPS